MNCARKLAFFVVIVIALGASCLAGGNPPAQNERAKIAAEVQRLRKVAAEHKLEGDWKDLEPLVTKLLGRAELGLKEGRDYAALEDVLKVWVSVEAYANSRMSGDAATMAAFEAAWKKADVELIATNKAAGERTWAEKPLVQRSLAESAQGQVTTMVEASRAYATVTDASYGYYYISAAKANADAATFVYGLRLPSTGQRVALRSWLPEIRALQKKVTAEFVPPKSIERHSDFIRVNSAIKLAGDLDAAKLYGGALYQYLTAVQLFAAMNEGALDGAKQAEVRKSLQDWNVELGGSKRDDSLAQMFEQRAELWINRTDGAEVGPEQWKAAESVVEAVLPAYEQALSAVPPAEIESKKLVTVTLVRWPYT